MELLEFLLLAFSLALDAFAVSISKGIVVKETRVKDAATCGLWFGGFQSLMPLIGYFIGSRFNTFLDGFASFIAFGLLVIIGINMIRENYKHDKKISDSFKVKNMLLLALATSLDALIVGVTFSFVPINIIIGSELSNLFFGVFLIGIITFALSCIGFLLGNKVGNKYKLNAELIGGIILICLGIKILIEHFF